MGTKGKVVAAAMLAGLAALGTMPAASATTSYTSYTVYANLDGDSARDRVTVSTAASNQIHVKFKLDDGRIAERDLNLSGDSVQHPKIHDIYNDGKDEVGVPVAVGANTITYALFRYDPSASADYRVRAVANSAGAPFRLYEGHATGGLYDEYSCMSSAPRLQQVVAKSSDGAHWDITRKKYNVSQNKIALASTSTYGNVSSSHPLLHLDPTTCN